MRYLLANVNDFRSLIPYMPLERSINHALEIVLHSREVSPVHITELEKVDEEIAEEDYGRALRDMRVLVEDSAKALLRKKGVSYGDKDELHVIKTLLIKDGFLNGRLSSWFDAFASFPNISSHELFPSHDDLDDNTRNQIRLTILLGKQLLLEIYSAPAVSDDV